MIVEEVRRPGRGLAAEVRQGTADDDGLDVAVTQDVVEVGAGERVVRVLDADHPLVGARVDLVVDVGAGGPFLDRTRRDRVPELVEVGAAVAGDVVRRVDHRDAERSARLDRALDAGNLPVGLGHAHGILRIDEVFLQVDDDEGALLPLDPECPVPVHVVVAVRELDELPLALEDTRRAQNVGVQQISGLASVDVEEPADGIGEVLARHHGLLRGSCDSGRTNIARRAILSSAPGTTSGLTRCTRAAKAPATRGERTPRAADRMSHQRRHSRRGRTRWPDSSIDGASFGQRR